MQCDLGGTKDSLPQYSFFTQTIQVLKFNHQRDLFLPGSLFWKQIIHMLLKLQHQFFYLVFLPPLLRGVCVCVCVAVRGLLLQINLWISRERTRQEISVRRTSKFCTGPYFSQESFGERVYSLRIPDIKQRISFSQ